MQVFDEIMNNHQILLSHRNIKSNYALYAPLAARLGMIRKYEIYVKMLICHRKQARSYSKIKRFL